LIASIMTDADPEGYTYEVFAKTPYNRPEESMEVANGVVLITQSYLTHAECAGTAKGTRLVPLDARGFSEKTTVTLTCPVVG